MNYIITHQGGDWGKAPGLERESNGFLYNTLQYTKIKALEGKRMVWNLNHFANLHSHKLQSIFPWGYYKYISSYNCYRDVCDQPMHEQINVEGQLQGRVSNSNDFTNY